MTRRGRGREIRGLLLSFGLVALLVVGLVLSSQSAPLADVRNGRAFIQDNLWSDSVGDLAVWIDREGMPWFAERPSGSIGWSVVALGDVAGNPLGAPFEPNLHRVLTVGRSADGVVHVVGNMFAEPLRYVRSSIPSSVDAWESAALPGASDRMTYPRFIALNDGELLFLHRAARNGSAFTGLHRLEPGAQEWVDEGAIVDGRESGDGPYLHRVVHDPVSDSIHIVFTWRTSPDPDTTNDVGHAVSDDGGRTWRTAAGDQLPTPILHDEQSTVLDTVERGSGIINAGGVVLDAAGRPNVVVTLPESAAYLHLRWTGSEWLHDQWDTSLTGRLTIGRSGDELWVLGRRGGRVGATAIADPDEERTIAPRVPPGWEVAIDSRWMDSGRGIRMLYPRGNEPTVVNFDD